MLFDKDAAGREIRATHLALQQSSRVGLGFALQFFPLLRRGNEFLNRRVRMIDDIERRRAKLRHVMWRNIGRHADRNARRTVCKQVRESARQNDRLFVLFIIGRAEIDGVFVDAFQQQRRHFRHTRFGVTHGSRVIAVDIAEVALPVHERITHREILRQTHQRIVDRRIAMRMELTHHITDDTGAFCIGLIGIETQQTHGVHDATMHRLQAVAHVRQRTMHDRRQRISEVTFLESRFEIDPFDVFFAVIRRNQTFSHVSQYQLRDSPARLQENQSSTLVCNSRNPAAICVL